MVDDMPAASDESDEDVETALGDLQAVFHGRQENPDLAPHMPSEKQGYRQRQLFPKGENAGRDTTRQALTVDQMLERHVGQLGRGQLCQFFVLNLAWILKAIHTFVIIFSDLEPDWSCVGGGGGGGAGALTTSYTADLLTTSAAVSIPSPASLSSSTWMTACNSSAASSSAYCQLPRAQWNWTNPERSTISDLGMFCDRNYQVGLSQSIFFLGFLVGAGFFGTVSDGSMGRKRTMLLACAIAGVSGLVTAASPNFIAYVILRHITGIGTAGITLNAFTLSMEMIGPKRRGKAGTLARSFLGIGIMLLPLIAFLCADSWRLLYVVSSVPSLFFVLLSAIAANESPRWLLVHGRTEKAMAILRSLARRNGRRIPHNVTLKEPECKGGMVAKGMVGRKGGEDLYGSGSGRTSDGGESCSSSADSDSGDDESGTIGIDESGLICGDGGDSRAAGAMAPKVGHPDGERKKAGRDRWKGSSIGDRGWSEKVADIHAGGGDHSLNGKEGTDDDHGDGEPHSLSVSTTTVSTEPPSKSSSSSSSSSSSTLSTPRSLEDGRGALAPMGEHVYRGGAAGSVGGPVELSAEGARGAPAPGGGAKELLEGARGAAAPMGHLDLQDGMSSPGSKSAVEGSNGAKVSAFRDVKVLQQQKNVLERIVMPGGGVDNALTLEPAAKAGGKKKRKGRGGGGGRGAWRDVFKRWEILKRLICITYIGFSASIAYYTSCLNIGNLGSNIYLSTVFNGLAEVPAYFLTTVLVNRRGHRFLLFDGLVLSGTCSIIVASMSTVVGRDIPKASNDADAIARLVIALMGKFGIAYTYNMMDLITTELFPTAVRNVAYATGSQSAQVGGAIATYIALLGRKSSVVPSIMVGLMSLSAAVVSLFLPETLHQPLYETVEEVPASVPLGQSLQQMVTCGGSIACHNY
ncbi:hypothetical protein CBR_g20123 [Chara braunii]|uniref:Major facilitator superfamily (MFS) profile domain-containing protein n=1 Tax=Chara braunii TaxID=69332 RepID=A0A388KZT1_CHABU|nr:hypothetical protein CBR_g20123 [Chara braunii]|eukprot:GBG75492.1 hypothetical protein CBR_g20123 [Chara braunii]